MVLVVLGPCPLHRLGLPWLQCKRSSARKNFRKRMLKTEAFRPAAAAGLYLRPPLPADTLLKADWCRGVHCRTSRAHAWVLVDW